MMHTMQLKLQQTALLVNYFLKDFKPLWHLVQTVTL